MKFGLSDITIQEMRSAFQKFNKIEKAVLFGSRVKGSHSPGSDIDIAIFGKEISFNEFLSIKIELDELDLLNKIDLVHFETIENPDFIDHINRVGVILYDRKTVE